MASDASEALSNSLAWDTEPRIVLDIPYKDQQEPLKICLDGVLQRLVELARHEGMRQTKSLAAECLHALVVYMVRVESQGAHMQRTSTCAFSVQNGLSCVNPCAGVCSRTASRLKQKCPSRLKKKCPSRIGHLFFYLEAVLPVYDYEYINVAANSHLRGASRFARPFVLILPCHC